MIKNILNKLSLLGIICFITFISCKREVEKHVQTTIKEQTIALNDSLVDLEIPQDTITLDSAALGIQYTPKEDYNVLKQKINRKRIYFKNLFQEHPQEAINDTEVYFYNTLLNEIIPHWYGTHWDFEGHTNTPNSGSIACGYFVSTTLKHMGLQINRYKMAQQAGMNEALTLQDKDHLSIFRNITYQQLKQKLLENYSNGIYFVGLSNHVGYILIKNKEIYFIHSSYYENRVMVEYAEHSFCFESDIYVIAEINTNKSLMEKWILGTTIPVAH